MAKSELGTKRVDPETGKKFYDLNKDPIVSPYTGNSYPRSFFESGPVRARTNAKEVPEEEEVEDEKDEKAEFISLEEADIEVSGGSDDAASDDDEDDAAIVDDDDGDVFIEEEEEEGDDVADIIGDVDEEEILNLPQAR